jgi:O-Antigen ligase
VKVVDKKVPQESGQPPALLTEDSDLAALPVGEAGRNSGPGAFAYAESILALLAVISVGYDHPTYLWTYPAEWGGYRSLVLSFGLVGLALLAIWNLVSYRPARARSAVVGDRVWWIAGAVLLATIGLSIVAAIAPILTLARLVEVAIGLAAASAIARRPALARWLVVGLAALVLVELPVALLQQVTQSTFPEGTLLGAGGEIPASAPGAFVVFGANGLRWERAMGTFIHPNLLGGFVALTLVLGLPQVLSARGSRGFWLAVWAAGWILLGLAFSRTAVLALVIGGAIIVCAALRTERRWQFLLVPPALVALGALLLDLAIAHDVVAGWFIPSAATLGGPSVAQRGLSVTIALDLIRAHPVLGIGAGNFTLAELLPPIDAAMVDPVHVVPLLVTAEAGPLAGLAWLALVLSPVFRASRPEARLSPSALAGLGASAALLTIGLLDHYLWSLPTGRALFWLTLGIARSGLSMTGEPEVTNG